MTKEEFLALEEKRYDALQDLNKLGNFYDYEKVIVDIWQEFGWETLENNLGAVPKDRPKKNFRTLGKIEMDNRNPFCKGRNGFQVSPRMQKLMTYAGEGNTGGQRKLRSRHDYGVINSGCLCSQVGGVHTIYCSLVLCLCYC
jgi:hypothetical protein